MARIRDLRTTDLSLYYYISDRLNTDGYTVLSGYSYPMVTSGIYLVDGHPKDINDMRIPSIAVEHDFSSESPFQLGPGRIDNRYFTITVYSRSDGERDDLGELIHQYLYRGPINIYDYNLILSGGTSDVLAKAYAENVTLTVMRDPQSRLTALQHIMEISFELEVYVSSSYSLIN